MVFLMNACHLLQGVKLIGGGTDFL